MSSSTLAAYAAKSLRMMITGKHCRMARAAVGWSVRDLADKARVATTTINRFELERGEPNSSTVAVIQRALEEAGVEFLNGGSPGVRLRASSAA